MCIRDSRILVQHDAHQQRLQYVRMAMSVAVMGVAVMGVASVPATKRHALKERMKTQTHHHPDRQSAVPVRVRMAVLDSTREMLEHHLDKKTD